MFASEVDGGFAEVGLVESGQDGMAYELVAIAVFVDGEVEPAVTAVGVWEDAEVAGVT